MMPKLVDSCIFGGTLAVAPTIYQNTTSQVLSQSVASNVPLDPDKLAKPIQKAAVYFYLDLSWFWGIRG